MKYNNQQCLQMPTPLTKVLYESLSYIHSPSFSFRPGITNKNLSEFQFQSSFCGIWLGIKQLTYLLLLFVELLEINRSVYNTKLPLNIPGVSVTAKVACSVSDGQRRRGRFYGYSHTLGVTPKLN